MHEGRNSTFSPIKTTHLITPFKKKKRGEKELAWGISRMTLTKNGGGRSGERERERKNEWMVLHKTPKIKRELLWREQQFFFLKPPPPPPPPPPKCVMSFVFLRPYLLHRYSRLSIYAILKHPPTHPPKETSLPWKFYCTLEKSSWHWRSPGYRRLTVHKSTTYSRHLPPPSMNKQKKKWSSLLRRLPIKKDVLLSGKSSVVAVPSSSTMRWSSGGGEERGGGRGVLDTVITCIMIYLYRQNKGGVGGGGRKRKGAEKLTQITSSSRTACH